MSSCSSNSVLTDYLAWAPPSDLCTDPALSLSLVPTEWPAGWFCDSVSISIFDCVAKSALPLSGAQQTLSCSNSRTCVFLFVWFCIVACLPNHQTGVLPIRHIRVMTLSVSDTLYWTMWVWLMWGIVCSSGCMSTWGLMPQFCPAVCVFPAVSLWLCVTDSLIICLAVSINHFVPFISATTWMTSHSWGVSPSLLTACRNLSVQLSSMSICLTVFFGRQLLTMFTCLLRDWFLKGNLLIIIVSVLIILPLALMRHLGKRLPELVIGWWN